MEVISLETSKLLEYRRRYNLDIFSRELDKRRVRLSVQAFSGILLTSDIDYTNPLYQNIRQYCNGYVEMRPLMLLTHDFSDSTTWPSTDNSLYVLKPYEGYKIIVTSIVARFSAAVDLTNNPLKFRIYRSFDGTPLTDGSPASVDDEYRTVQDIITISNDQLFQIPDPMNEFNTDMYQIKFRYTDSDLSTVSKLTMAYSLNERIEVELGSHSQLLDINGNAINDPCYLFFNAKRTYDF